MSQLENNPGHDLGRGKNRRDSQEPTGGPAHRKGSQTHSRWHSRWRRNMDMGRWKGHHLRRTKEDKIGWGRRKLAGGQGTAEGWACVISWLESVDPL